MVRRPALQKHGGQALDLLTTALKTEDDVRNWIVDVEENLLEKIQDGPIVISAEKKE